MERRLTEGSIGKSLIIFSLPMILGNLLQQLYNIVDTLIVGRVIGSTALSAVGSSYSLMSLLTSIILGLCMGSSVVFSIKYGAKRYQEMKVCIFNASLFVMLVSIFIVIIAFISIDNIISLINVPKEALVATKQYLEIIFGGIIFLSIYNFIAAILRSIGNTIMPLIFLSIATIINIVLDIILTVYLKMEVSGVAYATVISQIIAALLIVIYFIFKGKKYCPGKAEMYYDKSLLKSIIDQSVLTALQQSIMNFGILMIQGLVNSFGYLVSAAFAIVVKIDAFAYMPAQDFGNAFATFAAQNYGGDNHHRINQGLKSAIKISSIFCVLSSFFVFIFSKELLMIFIDSSNSEILTIGINYLHIEGVFYIGIGILFILYALYRGINKPAMSIVLTIISLGTRVLLAYCLSGMFGLNIIWLAVVIGWLLADLFGLMYWHKLSNNDDY